MKLVWSLGDADSSPDLEIAKIFSTGLTKTILFTETLSALEQLLLLHSRFEETEHEPQVGFPRDNALLHLLLFAHAAQHCQRSFRVG